MPLGCTFSIFAPSDSSIYVTHSRYSMRRVIARVVGRDSGLDTRTLLYHLKTRTAKGGCISTGRNVTRVGGVVGRLKRGPSRCGVTSKYKLSGCSCLSPTLLISFLGFTCSHASIFRGLCGTLPVTKMSKALGCEVRRKGTYGGIRTGANSCATVGTLTNCLGTTGKRRVTFTVVGRGMLSTTGTERFRGGIYRILYR